MVKAKNNKVNNHEIHVDKTKNLFDLKERRADLSPAGYANIAERRKNPDTAGDLNTKAGPEFTNKQNESTNDLVDNKKPVIFEEKVLEGRILLAQPLRNFSVFVEIGTIVKPILQF